MVRSNCVKVKHVALSTSLLDTTGNRQNSNLYTQAGFSQETEDKYNTYSHLYISQSLGSVNDLPISYDFNPRKKFCMAGMHAWLHMYINLVEELHVNICILLYLAPYLIEQKTGSRRAKFWFEPAGRAKIWQAYVRFYIVDLI
jgi:hypothetical protein